MISTLRFLFGNSPIKAEPRYDAIEADPQDFSSKKGVHIAETLPKGIQGPLFEWLVRNNSSHPVLSGNKVKIFSIGAEAFDSVSDAIQNAKEEILLETYILRDDETGKKILKVLGEAASRGVHVRVLADAYGSWGTHSRYWKRMKNFGIEVRLFHPFLSRFRGFLIRDHRKIIIVDRQISFTGGMNIANEYGSSRHRLGASWRDTHVRVEGETASEMVKVFNQGWISAGGTQLNVTPSLHPLKPGIQTLVLNSSFDRGHVESTEVFTAMVEGSRKRLWITNSYFAPHKKVIALLKKTAQRGIDVRLLLQGQTDMPLVRHAGQGYYSEILNAGVRIYEYQSEILHAKTIMVDDDLCVVGSSNLDFRSLYLNAECDILIMDESIGKTMIRTFEADLMRSTEIQREQWKKRSPLHHLINSLAHLLTPIL